MNAWTLSERSQDGDVCECVLVPAMKNPATAKVHIGFDTHVACPWLRLPNTVDYIIYDRRYVLQCRLTESKSLEVCE